MLNLFFITYTSGNKTHEVDVVYNKDRCTQINGMLNKNSDDGSGGTIALTIGLVLSLLGLFTASVVVFLKWRKKSAPAKKHKRYLVTRAFAIIFYTCIVV